MSLPRSMLSAAAIAALTIGSSACEDGPVEPPEVQLGALEAKGGVPGNTAGFKTSTPAFALPVAGGVQIEALATVGDVMPGSGEAFAPIPDGLGAWGGRRYMNVMLNHELNGVDLLSGGEGYEYSRVSKMVIDTKTRAILSHEYVVDGSEGYERLCSAEWVDARDGFPGGYFFTGEEDSAGGLQLAIDEHGTVHELPWIGYYAHENQISVPGFPGKTVVLNFDDTGAGSDRNGVSESELYMYVGRSSRDVLAGRGTLYVFASDELISVGDMSVGQSITGYWKPIPRDVAMNPDADVLQAYVDAIGVLEFVRLEDGWYDKRRGYGPGAMFLDTGRDDRVLNGDRTQAADEWGSIYYLDFDASDPTGETVLTLLDRSNGPATGWASPDNGDMSAGGTILVQEDRANDPWNRPAAIWALDLQGTTGVSPAVQLVELTDPDCPGPQCADDVFGFESSGIIDVSDWFGAGYWLFDIQAHSKHAPSIDVADENGQLLLLYAPGTE